MDFGDLLGNLGGLGNVEEIAGKLGIPADQVQGLIAKLGEGDIAGLMQAAQGFGLTPDKIQALLGEGGAQDLMSKATDLLGGSGGLGGMMKGFLDN